MNPTDDAAIASNTRRRRLTRVVALAGLLACALLGAAAGALPERAQQAGFAALSVVLAFSAWCLLVLALPRGRSRLSELGVCLVPALVGGLLVWMAEEVGRRELQGVRALTEHLWIHPGLAAFFSGAAAVGMTTLLARAALSPRAPGRPRSSA